MAKNTNEVCATGRRKCAVARVRMTPGTGKIVVNGRDVNEYFPVASYTGLVMQVLAVAGYEGKVDIAANLDGGGMAGQAGALRHGVARALLLMNEALRPPSSPAVCLPATHASKNVKSPVSPVHAVASSSANAKLYGLFKTAEFSKLRCFFIYTLQAYFLGRVTKDD